MKILQLLTAVDDAGRTGGVTEVALTQTEILRGLGHDVTLLAGWFGDDDPPAVLRGVPATLMPLRYAAGRRTGMRFVFSPRLQQLLRAQANSYDVAHVHLCRDLVTTVGTRTLARAGVPIVTQSHGMLTLSKSPAFWAFDRVLTRPALRSAARSLVLWPGEQEQLDAVLGPAAAASSDSLLIRNAVDVGSHKWSPGEPPVVLFAARMHVRKQPQLFVRIAQRVHREQPDVRFVIAGPDQGEEAAVRTLVGSLGLDDVVRVAGGLPREQLLELMAVSTVYVLPSLNEPFPISAMEAMAVGLPTVLTNQSGVSELARQRGAARIAAPDLDEMTEAVLEVLRTPEKQSELSKLGREMCATDLSRASLGNALTSCYESVRREST